MKVSNLQLPIELKKLRQLLKDHGVISASVFGSYARGKNNQDSDLDLLVKLNDSSSLYDLIDLQRVLEDIINHKVDIATKLHPRFEQYITPNLVNIL